MAINKPAIYTEMSPDVKEEKEIKDMISSHRDIGYALHNR